MASESDVGRGYHKVQHGVAPRVKTAQKLQDEEEQDRSREHNVKGQEEQQAEVKSMLNKGQQAAACQQAEREACLQAQHGFSLLKLPNGQRGAIVHFDEVEQLLGRDAVPVDVLLGRAEAMEALKDYEEATEDAVHALRQLQLGAGISNSSSKCEQVERCKALLQQFNLSGMYAGISLHDFSSWLGSDDRQGLVLVSGQWLGSLSSTDQQAYVDVLAGQGYLQLAEISDFGLLLASPSGLASMQKVLQDAVLQAQDNTRQKDAGKRQQGKDQGQHTTQVSAPGSQMSAGFNRGQGGSGGSADGSQGQNQDNSQQGGSDDPGQPSQDSSSAAVPGEKAPDCCVYLTMSSDDWLGWADSAGGGPTCRLQSHERVSGAAGTSLKAVLKQVDSVNLCVQLQVEACMMPQQKAVGFKIWRMDAKAEAADSVLSFMSYVKLSVEAQQLGGRDVRTTCCNEQNDLDTGVNNQIHTYKFKEVTWKPSVTANLAKLATFGLNVDVANKQAAVASYGQKMVRVRMNTEASPISSEHFSTPCTVEFQRDALATYMTGAQHDMGNIVSNSKNSEDKKLCYKLFPPGACLNDGWLKGGTLEVKVALFAVGAAFKESVHLKKSKPNVQEVVMDLPTIMRAGFKIMLADPIRPFSEHSDECSIHKRKDK
eukprot:gene3162-3440_t